MKRLLSVLATAVMVFAIGIAGSDAVRADEYNVEIPEGIELVGNIGEITYGDPAPKPKFKYNGKLMTEGVDFDSYYYDSFASTDRIIHPDYFDEKNAGTYVIKIRNPKGELKGALPHNSIYFDLCTFEVKANDISNLTYDPVPDVTYVNGFFERPVISNYYYGDRVIKGNFLHMEITGEEKALERTAVITMTKVSNNPGFTGELLIPYKVVPCEMTDDNTVITFDHDEYPFTGDYIKPNFDIKVGENGRPSLLDLDVSYESNYDVGTGTMTVTGKGVFSGTVKKQFKIVQEDISNCEIRVGNYHSVDSKPQVVVRLNYNNLMETRDFMVSYDPLTIGLNTLTVKGKGNLKGLTAARFLIGPIDINDCDVTAPDVEYDPSPIMLSDLVVSYEGYTLNYESDYILTRDSAGSGPVGPNTIKLFGKNLFTGEREYIYNVIRDISSMEYSVKDMTFTGAPLTPSISLLPDDGEIAVTDKLFKITIPDNINAGEVSFAVEGKKYYYGTVAGKFDILPEALTNCTVTVASPALYSGSPVTPEVTVSLGGNKLVKGRDYSVSYSDNTHGGKGTVTVTGLGNITGTRKLTFDIVEVTPTPKPTVTPTSKPQPTSGVTSKPTAGVTSAPVTKTPTGAPVTPEVTKPVITQPADPRARIMDFVNRIYIYVLDREPEEEGAAFWSDELWSFRRTGAEVGLQFIFSEEFVNRGLSDEDYVTVLYNTFFGREPEEGGFKFWTGALADGTMDRQQVAYGFVYSQEWADTCAQYGIRSGGDIKPGFEIDPTEATLAFVERMYTTAMERESDPSGLEFWSKELSNFRYSGEQVGVMFFLSEEMQGYALDNSEFVTRLYKTFMDRDPEEGGFNFWVGYLDDGGSREGAVLGFTRSEEFVSKCIEARILPY